MIPKLNPLVCQMSTCARMRISSDHKYSHSLVACSKKGGIGGGGWVLARGTMHMAAALACCRKAMVGTGLAISLLLDTNGRR